MAPENVGFLSLLKHHYGVHFPQPVRERGHDVLSAPALFTQVLLDVLEEQAGWGTVLGTGPAIFKTTRDTSVKLRGGEWSGGKTRNGKFFAQ